MLRAFCFGILFVAAGAIAAQAQKENSGGADAGLPAQERPADLLNEHNLTSTGETVPHPGVSQGAPPTPLDLRIRRQNNQIDQSICSNCK
jgi:hypothetical protein